MKIDPQEVELKFQFRNDDNMPALVTLTIGCWEMRGFRVMKTKFLDNKSRFVLYPPAIRGRSGKFTDVIRLTEKKEWEELQKIVLHKFDQEQNKFLMDDLAKKDQEIDVSSVTY